MLLTFVQLLVFYELGNYVDYVTIDILLCVTTNVVYMRYRSRQYTPHKSIGSNIFFLLKKILDNKLGALKDIRAISFNLLTVLQDILPITNVNDPYGFLLMEIRLTDSTLLCLPTTICLLIGSLVNN